MLEVCAGTEMTERFGHEHGQIRIVAKAQRHQDVSVLTEIGPAWIEVPRAPRRLV